MIEETVPTGSSQADGGQTNIPSFSVKHLLAFLILSAIGCFAICTAMQIYPFWVDYFPVLVLVGIWLMYALSSNHVSELNKPAEYLVPIFVTISSSFFAIALVFGLHGGVYDSYDQVNDPENKDYKWFKTREVLSFPVDQLLSKDAPKPIKIDFTRLKNPSLVHNIIIVDKTRSIRNSDKTIQQTIFNEISHKAG